MDSRGADLVELLFHRAPTEEELAEISAPNFNFRLFRAKLLLSKEGQGKWPAVYGRYRAYIAKERDIATNTQHLAHQAALMSEDIVALQKRFDTFQDDFISILRKIDEAQKTLAQFGDMQVTLESLRESLKAFESGLSKVAAQ